MSSYLGVSPSQYLGNDVQGFVPARLVFPSMPASGTITAVQYQGTRNPAPNITADVTVYSAAGAVLGAFNASATGLSLSYSGGQPYVVSNQPGSVFLTA